MEARKINEVRVYKLVLNHVRDKCEESRIVAISGNYNKLVEFYNSCLAPEPWRDGRYSKVFKEGSPLEWYNPANIELNKTDYWGCGISDEWIIERVWNNIVDSGRYRIIAE